MDIPATLRPASAGASPVAAGAPATAQSGVQSAALRDLASTVLDATGRASDADRLSAYNASLRMAVTGQFRELGPDDRRLLNQIGVSDTAQAVQGARATYESRMMAAIQQAGAKGAPHGQALGAAALAHFDALPDHEQNLLFSSLNAPDRTGATPFTGVSDWRGQMAAMGGVSAPVDRVELSDAAKAVVGATAAGPAPTPAAAPYVSGSVTNLKV